MIGAALIAMMAALGAQAGPAEQAPEPELVERDAMWFPPKAAKNDVVARCNVMMDIRPNGKPYNMCGVCNTATPHDFIEAEPYEKIYVSAVIRVLRAWRYKPTQTGFKAHSQDFVFNLAHLSPALIESIETPDAPVCEK